MSKFYVAKEMSLSMLIEVEATDEDEALTKVDDAWYDNQNFVNTYLQAADVMGSETYLVSSTDGYDTSMTLEEMCR